MSGLASEKRPDSGGAEESVATTQPSPSEPSAAPSRWITGILWGLSIWAVLQGVVLAGYLTWRLIDAHGSDELTLGKFVFEAQPNDAGAIRRCQFQVHLVLDPRWRGHSRWQLTAWKTRIRQDVEEVLRQARSLDFEDPSLTQLKRLVRERINARLQYPGVIEVLMTELTSSWNSESAYASTLLGKDVSRLPTSAVSLTPTSEN